MNAIFYLLILFNSFIMAAGSDPSSFLSFGMTARAFSLGGAYIALADDASAVYYNPALLTNLQFKNLVLSHSSLWEDTSYDCLGYAHPILDKGTVGLNIIRLYSRGAEKRDEFNRPIGNFDSAKTAFNLGYGRPLFKKMFVGLGAKFINSVLDTSNINFVSIDLSAYLQINHAISVGGNLQNILAASLGDTDDRLPLNFKIGSAYKIFGEKLLLSFELLKNGAHPNRICDLYFIGFESNLLNFLSLRVGNNQRELTAGFGLRYKLLNLDYAVGVHKYLGPSHRLSLTFRFGKSLEEIKIAKTPPPEIQQPAIIEKKPEEVLEEKLTEEEKQQIIQATIEEAALHYENGLYTEALEIFYDAIQDFPDDPFLKSYIEKLETIKKIVSKCEGPGKIKDILRRSINFFIEGDNSTAAKLAAYALSFEPNNLVIKKLVQTFEEISGIEVEKVTPISQLSIVEQKLGETLTHFRKRDYWRVITLCEEILLLEPNNAMAYKRMGSAFYMLGDKEKAKAMWRRSLELAPDKKLEKFLKEVK